MPDDRTHGDFDKMLQTIRKHGLQLPWIISSFLPGCMRIDLNISDQVPLFFFFFTHNRKYITVKYEMRGDRRRE